MQGGNRAVLPTENIDLRQGAGLQETVAVGGVRSASGINVQPVDTSVMDQLAAFGGEAIRNEAVKEQNKSMLDGEMAAAQGKAFSEVAAGGDKWKVEGYHQLEAQTMSSTLLAAQQSEIQNSAYALSPEEFRKQYVDRLDTAIAGKDPRVQELVRTQMAAQMPTLVADHTTANIAYSQQRTAESAVNAVDALSRDPTASAQLAALADPSADGTMAGLGDNARRDALTKGVVYAFQQDNRMAYDKLKTAGLLDQLTPEQKQVIESAKENYMDKQKQTFTADKLADFETYNAQVDNAEFVSPAAAAEAYAKLNAKYGVQITMPEAMGAANAARPGIDAQHAANENNLMAAGVAGDYGAMADQVAPALFGMESGGNYSIKGPVLKNGDYAIGKYQVMASNVPSWTLAHLGRRMTPEEFLADPAAQDAVYKGQFGGYIKNRMNKGQSPVDATRDAVSMWHSGRPYDKAVADGAHDVNMSTKNYTDTIMSGVMGGPTAQRRYDDSVVNLRTAQTAAQTRHWETLAPAVNDLDRAYSSGTSGMTRDQYQAQRSALYAQNKVAHTEDDINTELAIDNKVQDKIAANNLDTNTKSASAALDASNVAMQTVLRDPNASWTDQQAAIAQHSANRAKIMQYYGVPTTASEDTAFRGGQQAEFYKAQEAQLKVGEQRATVVHAALNGTLGTDSRVDSKMRDKWWVEQTDAIKAKAAKDLASNPKMTQQQADSQVQADTVKRMADTGYVPEDLKGAYSLALSGPMIDKNGHADARAVSTIEDYMTMKSINPRVADKLMDSVGVAKAEQILGMANNSAGNISNAIETLQAAGTRQPGTQPVALFVASPQVQDEITSAIGSALGDDKWFNWGGWRNPEAWNANTNDPSFREGFKAAVVQTLSDKFVKAGGRGDPASLAKYAVDQVMQSSAVLGGVPFVAGKGINLTAETFGPGNANLPNGDKGLQQEMMADPSSVDNAVRDWVVAQGKIPGSDVPTAASAYWAEQDTPAPNWWNIPGAAVVDMAKGVGGALNAADELVGLADNDGRAKMVNYTPVSVYQTAQGTMMLIDLVVPGEWASRQITVPLSDAGKAYIAKKQRP